MRKLIFLAFIGIIAFSCSNGGSSSDMKQQNDSLRMANADLEKISNELSTSLLAIDDNLQEIKRKENLISVNMNSPESNSEEIQDKINKDIKAIHDLMMANKEHIAELEKQLNSNSAANSQLKSVVDRLNRQLKEKSVEIIQLKQQLDQKDIKIASLNFTVEGLEEILDSLHKTNADVKSRLDSTTKELYSAYYTFGTKKELKEQNIITAEGLFSKTKVLEEDYNKNYFTKVDLRSTDEIKVYRPKIKILTSHPSNSYEITDDEEGNKVINIINKDEFWSISNYLVAQVN